ncbi:aldehyde dehydrogenase [Bacillus sp. DTU_2020_1000418_1_SI_GHA_SEK_038]|uniref:aldehyde dehydrogenase n=1 Tax=Bacillus sp. DTU_2020_1000418_1_SI_GHA_SEK_038 TaxID=3077585 RepID=UPI0028EBBBF8|nr:aldehyde dehydrogenase [Bacillus sp. DTU_2020_1000418_1_SI_GHA_SEK_038]WNS77508.1 aldehyde dehydrogenase [Bacillus sp. DTU_2020_1000418_1_SI_GHA_SEK_038]
MNVTELKKYKMYINGEWTESSSGEYFPSYNPATGEPWCTVAKGTAEDVDRAVKAAHHAFLHSEWARMTFTERGRLVRKLGELIAGRVEELAEFETLDNGKLIREMRGQLSYLPEFFYYYAGLADKIHGKTLPIDKKDMFVFTSREPLGVVAAITPWNSPLYLTTLKLAPALVAGNTIVIKPSEMTSASLLELMKLVEEAGFPPGVVNVVTGFGIPVGDSLTSHPLVRRVAFTGGEESARHVVRNSADNFAQVSLELGGKSPNIVFEDANADNAAMGIIAGIFGASGQSCVAGSRALLHVDIYDKVMQKLVDRVSNIKIGNPLHNDTEMGPLATKAQLDRVEQYVALGNDEGGKLVYGGKKPEHLQKGWFFEPTIFEHNDHNSRITNEEIFGPVLSVIPFRDETEVVQLANSTDYGLAAGIWVSDIAKAHRVAKAVRAGIVWVNTYRSISPIAPIGGSGLSGYGRESGYEAIHEYTQSKVVWVNTSSEPIPDPFIMR